MNEEISIFNLNLSNLKNCCCLSTLTYPMHPCPVRLHFGYDFSKAIAGKEGYSEEF